MLSKKSLKIILILTIITLVLLSFIIPFFVLRQKTECNSDCSSKKCGEYNGCNNKCNGSCPSGNECTNGSCYPTKSQSSKNKNNCKNISDKHPKYDNYKWVVNNKHLYTCLEGKSSENVQQYLHCLEPDLGIPCNSSFGSDCSEFPKTCIKSSINNNTGGNTGGNNGGSSSIECRGSYKNSVSGRGSSECSNNLNSDSNTIIVGTFNAFWWNLFGQRHGGNFSKTIKNKGPFDLMGFQEMEDIRRVLNESGNNCFDSEDGGHAIAIAWNSKKFEKLDSGKQDVAEDTKAQYYGTRSAQWIRLKVKNTEKTILFVNHHGPLPVDTGGKCGGTTTANNIIKLINEKKKSGDTVILVGDMNAGVNSSTVKEIQKNLKLVNNDWVDCIFVNKETNTSNKDIIHGSGSDHRHLKIDLNI